MIYIGAPGVVQRASWYMSRTSEGQISIGNIIDRKISHVDKFRY